MAKVLVSGACAFEAEPEIVAWQAAEISEDVADQAKQAIVKIVESHTTGRRVRTIGFLPTTKAKLDDKGSFELLANTTLLVRGTLPNQPFEKSEVVQSVVTVSQIGRKQKLEAVDVLGL